MRNAPSPGLVISAWLALVCSSGFAHLYWIDPHAHLAAEFTDRAAFPDAKLHDMEDSADPETILLIRAEMARRGLGVTPGT